MKVLCICLPCNFESLFLQRKHLWGKLCNFYDRKIMMTGIKENQQFNVCSEPGGDLVFPSSPKFHFSHTGWRERHMEKPTTLFPDLRCLAQVSRSLPHDHVSSLHLIFQFSFLYFCIKYLYYKVCSECGSLLFIHTGNYYLWFNCKIMYSDSTFYTT
jgi:hypothetical protein